MIDLKSATKMFGLSVSRSISPNPISNLNGFKQFQGLS
jgi:hypothetical protein